MARRKTIVAAEPVGPAFDGKTSTALAAVERQGNIDREKRDLEARELATRIGYQLPADETNPDLIQRDIAANMRRSVEACLEVGRGLIILKQVCGHGGFLPRLEALGIESTVAIRFMQAAAKFSNAATSQHLIKAIGNQSKLFEMLVLDDEQIEALTLTGQTGELSLDDVATMSVKELRAALRESREQIEAKDVVAGENQKTIQKLKEKLTRSKPTPEFLAQESLDELGKESVQCIAHISAGMRAALGTAMASVDTYGADRHLVEQSCASAIGNIFAALRSLAAEFDIAPQTSGINMGTEPDPSWAHVKETLAATKANGTGRGKRNA